MKSFIGNKALFNSSAMSLQSAVASASNGENIQEPHPQYNGSASFMIDTGN